MKSGIELIAAERSRQIKEEGWSTEHDSNATACELLFASEGYLNNAAENILAKSCGIKPDVTVPLCWPWEHTWWKPTPDDPIHQLTKAGALIAAEIDRIQAPFRAVLEAPFSDCATLEAQFKELWSRIDACLPDDDIEVLVFNEPLHIFSLAHHEEDVWISEDGDQLLGITHWMDLIPPETSDLQPQA